MCLREIYIYIFFDIIFICLFTFQTAAELERRRENFTKELDFVFADVVCFLGYLNIM